MSYFADLDSKRFSFSSQAMGLTESTFAVMSFKGYEAISKPYEFDILLVSNELELDLDEVLNSSAQFIIHRGDNDDVLYNGVLAEFEQLQEFSGHVVYRARLVPKLWWLTLTKHNQVFLNETVPEIVRLGLEDADFTQNDYDFLNVKETYEPLEYVCQYDETHFNFISRWLEREGIYYYFSQGDDGERLMFSDISTTSDRLPQADELFYSPASGLESTHLSEVIRSLTCRQKQLPREIILKDFNYEKPSLDVTGRADVDPRGRGTSYIYGEHYPTPEEGDRLAAIRAEELLCQKQQFFGESTVPFMEPGFTFNLLNHYRGDYNQEYLIVEVTHEGSQTACLTPEIIGGIDNPDDKVAYMNTFKAIPAITQYRPQKTTDRPRISGTLNAKIDAEGEGEYAELDEQGRYKVKLPFDINDQHLDGKASARVRMMQPYAGTNKGMQFPLNKGTEVLLSFIDGHPDRPIIAGAVNNPETPGIVNAENQSESVIQTGSTNKIRMEDKFGSERVIMESPAANGFIRIGNHNDPVTINGPGTVYLQPGESLPSNLTGYSKLNADAAEVAITPTYRHADDSADTPFDNNRIGVWTQTYHSGSNTPDTKTRRIVVTDEILDHAPGIGIRLKTAGDLSVEALNRYGEFTGIATQNTSSLALSTNSSYVPATPTPQDSQTKHAYTGDLVKKFKDGTYNPTGIRNYTTGNPITFPGAAAGSFAAALQQAQLRVSSLDTINTQEGNIYDFGGYWNYNLGNCYIENWIAQDSTATLNWSAPNDLLDTGGPGWKKIKWPTYTPPTNSQHWGGTGTHNIDNEESTQSGDGGIYIDNKLLEDDTTLVNATDGPDEPGHFSNGKVWVEKKVGTSYDYHYGHAISVSKGSTLDVTHGGRHVEVGYRGDGTLSSWSRSESGTTKEKKWTKSGVMIYDSTTESSDLSLNVEEKKFDRDTGDLFSHEISTTTGMATASFAFNFGNKASCEINTGSAATFSADISAKVSIETFASLSAKLELGVGAAIKMENPIGGTIGLKWDHAKGNFTGFEFERAAAIAAQKKTTALKASLLELNQRVLKIHKNTLSLSTRKVSVREGINLAL